MRNKSTKKILKGEITGYGYYRVSMCLGSRKSYYKEFIHKLVAMYFINNKLLYQNQVNHIDGDKSNNSYSNLEWCNQSENNIHAVRYGLSSSGEDRKNATLTNEIVKQICSYLETGMTYDEIINELNIVDDIKNFKYKLQKIKTRKNWKMISENYTF